MFLFNKTNEQERLFEGSAAIRIRCDTQILIIHIYIYYSCFFSLLNYGIRYKTIRGYTNVFLHRINRRNKAETELCVLCAPPDVFTLISCAIMCIKLNNAAHQKTVNIYMKHILNLKLFTCDFHYQRNVMYAKSVIETAQQLARRLYRYKGENWDVWNLQAKGKITCTSENVRGNPSGMFVGKYNVHKGHVPCRR